MIVGNEVQSGRDWQSKSLVLGAGRILYFSLPFISFIKDYSHTSSDLEKEKKGMLFFASSYLYNEQ